MFTVDIDGRETWYCFLQGDGGFFSSSQRDEFTIKAIKGYRDDKEVVRIKGQEFEARLERGKFVCFGGYSGRVYQGVIESQKGKKDISVILNERDTGIQN